MNLIEAKVTKVMDKPQYKYGKWFVKVEFECEGVKGTTSLCFDSEVEALAVGENFEFLT